VNRPPSLADSAVSVLAAVAQVDMGVEMEHDERHHVRTLKRLAEKALEEGMRAAQELAHLAGSMRHDAENARAAAAPPRPAPAPAKFDARADASQLRSTAAGLTYNGTPDEAAAKHLLLEIAMRLETGGYLPQEVRG
jgi:hypothetical protein